jgi:hypothetical protein
MRPAFWLDLVIGCCATVGLVGLAVVIVLNWR